MLQRIRTTRFMLALIAATALLFAIPISGIASAHDQLISSSPVDGEEFEQAPSEATLRFSAEMIEIGAEIALQNADSGEIVELPDAFEIDYDTLTQPLPALPAGAYLINWRVVSQDGHPISGTINSPSPWVPHPTLLPMTPRRLNPKPPPALGTVLRRPLTMAN